MKKIVLSLACCAFFSVTQAQKAEVKAALSAFNSNSYKEVVDIAKQAVAKLKDGTDIEPETLAEFYNAAGSAAQKVGNLKQAAEFYSTLSMLESKPYFYAKNKDTKETLYFWDKAKAEKTVAAGNFGKLKERQLPSQYAPAISQQMNDLSNQAMKEANDAFQAKNYKLAGDKFLETYELSKAAGNEKEIFYYYAGISYLQTDEKQKAAAILNDLVDKGFTGVQTTYSATVKETGEKMQFSSKENLDAQVKLGIYVNPVVEQSESLEEDLFSNATYANYSLKQYAKGIEIAEMGLSKYPDNDNMNKLVSSMYFSSGQADKFKQGLVDKIKEGKAKAVDFFNLGKLEDDAGEKEKARGLYLKAIEKDANFDSPYINLGMLIISGEKPFVEAMNANLGTTGKEKKIYKDNAEKRKMLYKEALPYLEKAYTINNENTVVVSALKAAYQVVGNDEKYFEFKNKLDKMK